ncbi:hypothetical protein AK812_SmicGene11056 [Symbiodinium microadriaticum]|uniref:ATP-dependent DNA helicase n=1 Tax=Symbiodinium microadriaticum TaxID=2951 RepID=A0A1Q9EE73_SYMMI|nr:hypothetical protein AK812_SmicGene11056 [Symbiodinium microadriaticum]
MARHPSERCSGLLIADGEERRACIFSTTDLGRPSLVQPGRQQTSCLFCSRTLLTQRLGNSRGKGVVTAALAFFKEHSPEDVYTCASQRIRDLAGEVAWADCEQRLQQHLHKCGATAQERNARVQQQAKARAQRRGGADPANWATLLEARQTQFDPSSETIAVHERYCSSGLRTLRRKFPAIYGESGRPAADWQTDLAKAFTNFANNWSWRMCRLCSSPLFQHADTVPPGSVLSALALLDVYTGPAERAPQGYWVHTSCVRFSWKPTSVEERLSALPRAAWRSGRAAYTWLIAAETCPYREFLRSHTEFLRHRQRLLDHGDVDAAAPVPWLPLRFMETIGLESAIWPHLYWDRTMCETYVRSMDARRLARVEQQEGRDEDVESDVDMMEVADQPENELGDSDSGREAEPTDDPRQDGAARQSAKASFIAKVFSSVIGYGTDRVLAHFVYDLWMWSSLGGARNAAPTNLRGALAGRSFSPLYWRNMHAGLVDCVRQLGFPSMFVTVAPFELSAPYHHWLQDELRKACRCRANLSAAETFHLSHLLFQTAEGLLAGTNRQQTARRCRRWDRHVLASRDPAVSSVLEIFGRLEFQDGKRKRQVGPGQSYHGSGRVHLHLLIWLKDADSIDWPRVVRADIPDATTEPELHDLVRDSQQDWDDSAWPRRDGPTIFDSSTGVLHLHHPADAHAAHVRAYLPDVLGALQCHMDVQMGDGRGMLLQYAASYNAKFSDQFATAWLNEEATDFQLARKVLMEYHPLEPEMWLQLAGQQFRQVLQTGVLRRVVVHPPWAGFPPSRWESLYTTCAWRSESCTFLEYMRQCNQSGDKRKNKRRVLVAATLHSPLRDSYFGQWLLLNVPFRSLTDLWDDRVAQVPEGYRMLALCLLHRPGYWRRLRDVQRDLELEGHKNAHICNVLSMLEARTAVVDSYLSGQLVLDVDMPPQPDLLAAPEVGYRGELDPEQAVVVEHVRNMLRWALERRYPEDADPTQLHDSSNELVAIRRAAEAGANVGVACPTGMLASAYREKFPGLDVDTLHGMFLLHFPQEQTWDCMASFDLVVIDEVGQLSRTTFERILWLWDNADRRPALVFVGDFHQLRGMDPTRASDSPRWQRVVKRHLQTMRRCKCSALRWKLELLRTTKPSKDQLLRLLRGHRAMPDRGPGVSPEPTELDVQGMLGETPHTLFLTITRRNAALLNDLAVRALYGDAEPLCFVPGDYESNVDNYDRFGQLVDCAPLHLPIYAGMRVTLTRNVQKEQNFVNGMRAVVLAVQRSSVLVQTHCGDVISVFPYTDDEILIAGQQRRVTYLPLRLGYATTLQKIQGATLEHITVWLDVPNVEAAAYVALSRVQYDENWRFMGHVTRHHFTPASGV